MATRSAPRQSASGTDVPLTAHLVLIALLLLSLISSLYLCAHKLFWEDELLEYFSDARPTVAAVLQGQLHSPFSLEPPAFHLLLHFFQKLPLRPEIATRLPSVAALLILQLCLFYLLLALTRKPAPALIAAFLPFFLATYDYSAEARVYSLLTAAYAVAFCGYRAALSSRTPWRIAGSLTLFVSLTACVLLHYYGVLLPLPFLFAEVVRFANKRQLRLATLLPILLSLALFTLNLPFLAGLRDVQAMYYDSGEAHWDMIPFTWLWVVLRGAIYILRGRPPLQTNLICLAVTVVIFGYLFLLWLRSRRDQLQHADSYTLLALAAGLFVPACNVAIGILHAHAYSPRYSMPVAVPIAALTAFLLSPYLFSPSARRPWLVAPLLLLALVAGFHKYRNLLRGADGAALAIQQDVQPNSTLLDALKTSPDPHIYIQDLPIFLSTWFYAPPSIQAHLVNVQSVAMEWHWLHFGPSSLFSAYMARSTRLPITTYEQLAAEPGPHLVILYTTSAEWLLQELATRHASVLPLGSALGGDLYRIEIPTPNAP